VVAAVVIAVGGLGATACTTSPTPSAAAQSQAPPQQTAPAASTTPAGTGGGTGGSAGTGPAVPTGSAGGSGGGGGSASSGGSGSVGVDGGGSTVLPSTFPSDFPLPPGADVTLTQDQTDGDGPQFALDKPEPKEILDFYRSALPAAGYQITKQTFIGDGTDHPTGTLSFSGHQVTGAVDMAGDLGGLSDFKTVVRLDK
jgi:hypothetical protein